MSTTDYRRLIPRTDDLLAMPGVAAAREWLSETEIRRVITEAQQQVRDGEGLPQDVGRTILERLARRESASLTPVINATGVVIHTNLGRAPLSAGARRAVERAAGYADVEMDLATGVRSTRGAGTKAALLAACPAAEDALVVNNGAAALLLAVTALGATSTWGTAANDRAPGDIVVSRGELVEIGAGFRLTDLMETTGARLREVGTTNRTHAADYERVLGATVGCVLKVHPSNFRVEGFTSGVEVAALRALIDAHEAAGGRRIPLIVDLGSGLIDPDPTIPDEPDLTGALRAGADVVIASGDKLLGGPQAGILLGTRAAVGVIAKHPLARAVRADKLALAALEATLRGGQTPVGAALHATSEELRARTDRLAEHVSAAAHTSAFEVVPHDGRVGGGGAPGVPLPGWALALPEEYAPLLRTGSTPVVPRVSQSQCLVDLRCVAPEHEQALAEAIAAVATALSTVTTVDSTTKDGFA
ncbi:L-seryl-tRNA(Sec) selenium transferase [Leucobacter salsicius]|uniref:L-seryl-tRNA(Sec) selenium transferase n=1 Tax=Leucobacter salsicius TaxID=664638 RepID=UPI0003451599|nr:L-seryl-tRNA(Sec) selenium transferase [Leucobacter salsicius]